ncbi:MAG: hypothetical protein ACRYFW_14940 [Janthinobacterium lividum]
MLADARSGREEELDRWYTDHHAPDIASIPGFTTYSIGTFSPTQMIPDPKGQHHLALFGLATNDLAATIAAFRERAPHLTPGPDLVNLWGYTYRPIGPELSGDRIRTERAHAAH